MNARPTRFSSAVFATKAALLRAHRSLTDIANPVPRHSQYADTSFPFLAAQSITPLWTDESPSEQWYQRSKVENLRLAAARLDNCHIPAGQTFSFWRQVGKATARKGYQRGRMLQEGCMIPAVGGGLCQLSNALYQVALDSGCTILERHRHSRLVPGSATAANRDATVAWNYIDLRFRPPADMQLCVELTAEQLTVSLRSNVATSRPLPIIESPPPPIGPDHACDTCGQTDCFRQHSHAEIERL
ncbi:MAG: VanW family protein [Acidobacteriota bacterium]